MNQSNAISGGFVYDNGYLYASTGTYSGKGSLVALTTKDEDTSKDYEVKEITWQKENDATYYWDKAKSIGNVIVICDASGKLKSYDKKTGEVKSEVKIDNKFSGGIAVMIHPAKRFILQRIMLFMEKITNRQIVQRIFMV